MQPSALLCDSVHGEPLEGHAYINTKYSFEGLLGVSPGDDFEIGGLRLCYQVPIWGDDLFDVLVSEQDFFRYHYPIRRVIYGISPFASRAAIDRLNEALGVVLPHARFSVVMDRNVGVHPWSFLRVDDNIGKPGIAFACLLTYYMLFRYLLERRASSLAVARLVGCRRWQLSVALTGESILNALVTFLLVMGVFSGYRLVFACTPPRTLLLFWLDALPILIGSVIISGALGALASRRCLRRPLTDVQRGMW